jgi:hypothetical protein
MNDMYIKGILLSGFENRGSYGLLHIIDDDVIKPVIKTAGLTKKEYRVATDPVFAESVVAIVNFNKINKFFDIKPKTADDYMNILRGAIDASGAEIYDDKIQIRMDYEMLKEIKNFLKKEKIYSAIRKKDESYADGILTVSGKSLDKLASLLSQIDGASTMISKELNKAKI